MAKVVLYTIHCSLCNTLKMLLDRAGIPYEECTDKEYMIEKGMTQMPMLGVDDKLYNFSGARTWIMQQQNN